MVLVEEGKIELNNTLKDFYTRSLLGTKEITIYNLLTHSSGLPAHKHYYKKLISVPPGQRKSLIIDWILREPLSFQPGYDSLYSDLGFILLGDIVERVAEMPLDLFWEKQISTPLRLENELHFKNTLSPISHVYSTTGWCGWTNTELLGNVHDDNCRAIGGVAGHAGLFGTNYGVLKLCETMFKQFNGSSEKVVEEKGTLDIFFKKKVNSSWTLGFDTPTGLKSSSGTLFSEKSIGHLGFTGTSFWMDLQKGIGIVLLTNRVACNENIQNIQSMRPEIHDAIMNYLT